MLINTKTKAYTEANASLGVSVGWQKYGGASHGLGSHLDGVNFGPKKHMSAKI